MADWLDGGGSGKRVDVEALLDGKAGEGIHALVNLGALVSLGTTSDGGALGVTVTVDGRYRREYFREAEDLVDWLSEAIPGVRAAVEAAAASSGRGGRKRSTRSL